MHSLSNDGNEDVPIEECIRVLDSAPVRLALLFGSQVTGKTHSRSDIDIAIELDSKRPGDSGYNDEFFGISAQLSAAAGTDNIDLVDLHSVPSHVARSILENGVVIIGDPRRVGELRRRLGDGDGPSRSPRDRFDEYLERIDELLA